MNERKMIPLEWIKTDPDLQIRVKVHEKQVLEYVEQLQERDLDPVHLFLDPNDGLYLLGEGHIRVLAYHKDGRKKIPAYCHEGDKSAALYQAIASNRKHGFRLTVEDRRRAVTLALADPRLSKMPVRQLAEFCRVSNETVMDIKNPGRAEKRKAKREEREQRERSSRATQAHDDVSVTPGATVQDKLNTIRGWIRNGTLGEEDVIAMFAEEEYKYYWLPKENGPELSVTIHGLHPDGNDDVYYMAKLEIVRGRELCMRMVPITVDEERLPGVAETESATASV